MSLSERAAHAATLAAFGQPAWTGSHEEPVSDRPNIITYHVTLKDVKPANVRVEVQGYAAVNGDWTRAIVTILTGSTSDTAGTEPSKLHVLSAMAMGNTAVAFTSEQERRRLSRATEFGNMIRRMIDTEPILPRIERLGHDATNDGFIEYLEDLTGVRYQLVDVNRRLELHPTSLEGWRRSAEIQFLDGLAENLLRHVA